MADGVVPNLVALVHQLQQRVRRRVGDAAANPDAFADQWADQLNEDLPAQLREPGNWIPGGGVVGQLRRGGRPDLAVLHKTPASGLQTLLAHKRPSLVTPSMMVTKGGENFGEKFGDITMVLRGEAVDPRNAPTVLLNRDFYTQRTPTDIYSWSPEQRAGLIERIRERATSPMQSRERALRMTEGAAPKGGVPHELSIRYSPEFRSFEAYEKSPLGAKLLAKPSAVEEFGAEQLRRHGQLIDLAGNDARFADTLVGLASSGLPHAELARELLARAKRAPTTYAEGKYLGELPVNRDTVQGVVAGGRSTIGTPWQQRLNDLGIPFILPRELVPASAMAPRLEKVQERFDEIAGLYQRGDLVAAADLWYDLTRQYPNWPSNAYDLYIRPAEALEDLKLNPHWLTQPDDVRKAILELSNQ